MKYISAKEASEKWGITKRRVQVLCTNNRVEGAAKVGNMWVIPECSNKPNDARYKSNERASSPVPDNTNREMRNKIKLLTEHTIRNLIWEGYEVETSRLIMIASFACGLFSAQNGFGGNAETKNLIKDYVYNLFDLNSIKAEITDEIENSVISLFQNNSSCMDDALSWCYQYANKYNESSPYTHTQFFTEKYMISTLVNSIPLSKENKIMDPACGGGNFLLYCADVIATDILKETTNYLECCRQIQKILDRLYGYEIDIQLCKVATINLILKATSILIGKGFLPKINDVLSFTPMIFAPTAKTVGGALEVLKKEQQLFCGGTRQIYSSNQIFKDCDVVLTNPPFQTIKGMDEDLKEYLKINYPQSKCDMCNAFLQFILELLPENGFAAMVTQNSWMYLDSYTELRIEMLNRCSIQKIWELGPNAFYDLTGEKSNVALLCFCKKTCDKYKSIELYSLKSLSQANLEQALTSEGIPEKHKKVVQQKDILLNEAARFDMISSDHLQKILRCSEKYGQYAIPMQGTSTGDAKNLVDFFWNHINDSKWVIVSKGGSYSRWKGLNHYSVKWGNQGEYIKNTKGSAIRNAGYFNQTQLVFSDTGTSGLNVRELLPTQIFVASGPGIRNIEGKKYAHLAFLNSRFAAYFIRLLSPKLTISAGYISKIPLVAGEILNSEYLDKLGQKCTYLKNERLKRRPYNYEFEYYHHDTKSSIENKAFEWFLSDVEEEWQQLKNEQSIEEYINNIMSLSTEDLSTMENLIGIKKVYGKERTSVTPKELNKDLNKLLDANCWLLRTRAEKNSLGCDGIIEFLAQKYRCSCESIYKGLVNESVFNGPLKKRYIDLYLHALTMSAAEYKNTSQINLEIDSILDISQVKDSNDRTYYNDWLINSFNDVHFRAMMESPMFLVKDNKLIMVKREL